MNRLPQCSIVVICLLLLISCKQKSVQIEVSSSQSPRLSFGLEKLKESLNEKGFSISSADAKYVISLAIDSTLKVPEAYSIRAVGNQISISGFDDSGLLYGCLDLKKRVTSDGIPEYLSINEAPTMKLRGTAIGLQKSTYLPERHVYEYPYTPETFPWFYDKELWIKYLDMMVENKYNSLYLWNGHPFASLVYLDDYPYALEVSMETFQKNEEIYTFLTKEADKRGIWVIQMFYNIIVSKPFAEHHNIKTQDRSRPIIPVVADYTRQSLAAFVEKYPNVGLLVALGEAMQGIETDIEWFTETIIPGVRTGLNVLNQTKEPPIVLRGHDTNASAVMEKALPLYSNLYTLNKYNGESLTTYEPRGKWADYHNSLSKLGSTHIDNVHILANLEPFRYGSPDFIQKSTQAMVETHGANGLHLYPQTSYWEWPYAPDKTDPLLLEIDRDWIWYKAWGRYAWSPYLDRAEEIDFWSDQLEEMYGCSGCGDDILTAYETSGEVSPMILRRYGITEGNRQTMTLGMFMSQLVSPEKFSLNYMVYESHGPEGELLSTYADKVFKGEELKGETPAWAAEKIVELASESVSAIEKVSGVTKNKDEFDRLKNDMYCYQAMANFYSQKAKAAMAVLNFRYSSNIDDLKEAESYLTTSIEYFKELVNLTKDTYRYANSMQTAQRRIPIGGNEGKNKTWEELLPYYQDELVKFRKNIALLEDTKSKKKDIEITPLPASEVDFTGNYHGRFTLEVGSRPFSENDYVIEGVAEELKNLKGITYSFEELDDNDTWVSFSTNKPVKMVIGFFQSDKTEFLSPPTLEFDASANFYGQADIKLLNALKISGLPPVNVHTYYFEAGEHSLLFDNDVFLLLGFMDGNVSIKPRDAGYAAEGNYQGLDWLFY